MRYHRDAAADIFIREELEMTGSPATSVSRPDGFSALLAWVGIGFGALELLAPRVVTRTLGVPGHETLIQALGVREVATGVLLMSGSRQIGQWTRLAGDGLNLGLLAGAMRRDNPKRWIAGIGLLALGGLVLYDLHKARSELAAPTSDRR